MTPPWAVFTEQNIGLLPVGPDDRSRRILGVVEQRDLLRALHLSSQVQP